MEILMVVLFSMFVIFCAGFLSCKFIYRSNFRSNSKDIDLKIVRLVNRIDDLENRIDLIERAAALSKDDGR